MPLHNTSNGKSDLDDKMNGGSAVDLTEHRSYQLVLKMVLWGGSREDVCRRLAVNQVPKDVADRLYEHARADRIRTIRSDCAHDLRIGFGLMIASAVTFCGCWFGLGFIPRALLYLCFAGLGVGLWKFIDGFTGYLMAPSKTGSVSDCA